MSDKMIQYIFIGIAGIATGVGALPILFTNQISQRMLDTLLGFAAGIMLAATSFSLIIPSMEAGGGTVKAVLITSAGILVGGILLDLFDLAVPHMHQMQHETEGLVERRVSRIWLFVFAVALHNFPEGMATGVGFGGGNMSGGMIIAMGIAIQNIPEGLAVAIALRREDYGKRFSFLVASATGLVEPVGAFLGLGLVHIFEPMVGFILALAAGAMLFVISDEIIPETHSGGFEREATYGIMLGFCVMLVIDVLLG